MNTHQLLAEHLQSQNRARGELGWDLRDWETGGMDRRTDRWTDEGSGPSDCPQPAGGVCSLAG